MLYKKCKNKDDMEYILNNLRSYDIEESRFIYGENWKEETLNNIMKPEVHAVIGVDKKTNMPVCMGGVTPVNPNMDDVGIVWLLSTDMVKYHKYSLLKELKKEFELYDKKYHFLYNFIFYKNNLAKNWLKWLGFKFDLKDFYSRTVSPKFEFFYRMNK